MKKFIPQSLIVLVAITWTSNAVSADIESTDDSYGTAGIATVDFGSAYDAAYGIYTAGDDKTYVVGATYDQSGSLNIASKVIARLLPSGALDASFGTQGRLTIVDDINDPYTAVAVDTNGKLLLGRCSGGRVEISRIDATGAADASFGTNGTARIENSNATCSSVAAIRVDSQKRVVIAGTFHSDFYLSFIARLTSTGTADSFPQQTNDYLNPGIIFTGEIATDTFASTVTIGSNDSIFVGGNVVPRPQNQSTPHSTLVFGYSTDGSLLFQTYLEPDGVYTNALALVSQGTASTNVLIGYSVDHTYPTEFATWSVVSGQPATELQRKSIELPSGVQPGPSGAAIDSHGRAIVIASAPEGSSDVMLIRYVAQEALVRPTGSGGSTGGATTGEPTPDGGGGAFPVASLLVGIAASILSRRRRRP